MTDMDNIRARVITGISWNTSARIIQQAIQFLLSVLLARILDPEEFGTVGLIAVFTGFAALFLDAGFGAAIVQRKVITNAHLNSAFWMSFWIGLFICILLVLLAPIVNYIYPDSPTDLTLLVQFSALNFIVIPLGMVPTSLLQKAMAFDRLARIEIIASVFSTFICAGLALSGWGVWSLMVQAFALNLSSSLLKWRISGWQPQVEFTYDAFRDLWSFSVNLLGFNVINYWARNGDNLVIGRILGSGALGIYTRAYSLMLLPINQIMRVITSVMFSALSAIQDDKPRVKRVYLEATSHLTFIIAPIMLGLSVVADPFITTVYGAKWVEVIPVLQILGFVGLVQSVMYPVGWLYTSQGQMRLMFWWGVFGAGFQILSILVGALLGSLISISQSYAIANLLLLYPAISIPGRFVNMTFSDLVLKIYRPIVAAVIMGIPVQIWISGTQQIWSPPIVLTSATVLGAVVYMSAALLWRIPTAHEALRLIRSKILL